MTKPPPHRTIGYQEYVDLPAWGVRRLLAKADTGARSSALDAKNITELDGDRVRFDLVLSRRDRENTVTVEAPIVRHTRIKSSHGHITERYVVEAELHVGSEIKTIEVTLVSRKTMICRMLLGRTALGPTFLVDSSRRFVLSDPP
ncbi:MAG: RimK/LysX family protein, partial [Planctomycetota bacterium]